MSSSPASSSTALHLAEEMDGPRPEAGPLPRKIGELMYIPAETRVQLPDLTAADASDMALRPHPAESSTNLPIANPSETPPPLPSNPPDGSHSATDTASIHTSKSSLARFFHLRTKSLNNSNRPMPFIHGIRLSTLLRVIFISLTLIGIIVGWGVTVSILQRHAQSSRSPPGTPDGPNMGQENSQSYVFIHVGFGVVVLLFLIFLERAVFLARAERFRSLHTLSSSSETSLASRDQAYLHTRDVLSYAPWNRPPLPTYASALGFRGTGDVEDAAIAAPPPPEYGNTRGSTLLLSSMLRRVSSGSTRTDRPVSYASQIENERGGARGTSSGGSHDEDGDAADARRARMLEEALAALESSESLSVPPPAVVRR